MKTGLSQHTGLRQELRVNPRLYQAMDMLYMPMMDLQQHLKQELLANPFLELLEPEEEETPEEKTSEQEKEKAEKEDEIDWEEILLNGFEVGGTREQFEQQEYIEPVTVESKDLIDHLREQLQLLDLTPRQRLLSEEFLGNIMDDGYLAASLEEIHGSVNQLVQSHFSEELEDEDESDAAREEILEIRHSSLYAPRDFDISPYFEVVKPTVRNGFDYKAMAWADLAEAAALVPAAEPAEELSPAV